MKRRRPLGCRLAAAVLVLLCWAPVWAGAQQGDAGAFLSLRLPALSGRETGSQDCALGSLTADALRAATGADLAVVCGGELNGDLPQGALTREDVEGAVDGSCEAAVAVLTPAQLRALLEELVSHVTLDLTTERIDRAASAFDGFPNLSGCTLVYDASAPAGERVVSITLDDGSALDLEDAHTVCTVAAGGALFQGGYGAAPLEAEPAGLTLADALYAYLADVGRELSELDWNRVIAIGAHENELADRFGSPLILACCLLIPIGCMIWINRRRI